MNYTLDQREGAIIVAVSGRVDESSWVAFGVGLSEAIEKAREAGLPSVVIDLTELEYMSSRGLRVLTVAKREGEDAGAAIAAPRIQTSPLRRDVEVKPGFSSDIYAALVNAGYRPGSRIADLTFGAVHAVHVRRDGVRIGPVDEDRVTAFVPPFEREDRVYQGTAGEGIAVEVGS